MLSKLVLVTRPSDAEEGLRKRTDRRAELLPVDYRLKQITVVMALPRN